MGINLKKFWAEIYFLLLKYQYLTSYGVIILLKNKNQKVLLSCSVALYASTCNTSTINGTSNGNNKSSVP